ncbi:MAG: 5'/3'-nucleotidase SurE [Desulfurococcales archaeon]|nr:5'/3'-nucleotidase SurE [Desulfurococcales archaeon]
MAGRILVANDDSYLSKGLYLLYEAVRGLGEARIYSTLWPRSAVGHTVSFNKPLRMTLIKHMGYDVYVVDGSPVDALHLAVAAHGFQPDLVVSGVNVGENLSMQHILYSGTIAVAVEAALMGIPAAAFSADVHLWEEFEDPRLSRLVRAVASSIAGHLLERGLPEGVDLLSVNFPAPDNINGCVRLARAARRRWRPDFERRLDTRGRPYYWLQPIPLSPKPGTDVHAVVAEGCVSITPLMVDMNAHPSSGVEASLESLARRVEAAIGEAGV